MFFLKNMPLMYKYQVTNTRNGGKKFRITYFTRIR
jgi:hypothetical protein